MDATCPAILAKTGQKLTLRKANGFLRTKKE